VTRRRILLLLLLGLIVLPAVLVAEQAIRTLRVLRDVERERDTWQRPDDVLRELGLRPGMNVVDLGSGAGYFALKLAPRVTPGQVLAVDLRRESLAFLWIRAILSGYGNLHTIRGDVDAPHLPAIPVDAVLIVNTFHELTGANAILDALSRSMRAGAPLVIVDRAPRTTGDGPAADHEISGDAAERIVKESGFDLVRRDDRFIDRRGDTDVWWLMTFRRPRASGS